MRLINVHTLEFGEFFERNIPPYAILSHRWTEDEITFKQYLKGRNKNSAGFRKVVEFCELVAAREICTSSNPDKFVEWVWMDTCCIDKKSSAELSEAINSMFNYYSEARLCVVYLADFERRDGEDMEDSLRRCSWFWRGWTLQELIAPNVLVFCDASWAGCGVLEGAPRFHTQETLDAVKRFETNDLLPYISAITRIPSACLTGNKGLWQYCVAEKMSWAAKRETTRKEDEAYCLIGLFELNMPLLYGEGRRAFQRLQEEIIKKTADQSILAWRSKNDDGSPLASGLRLFSDANETKWDRQVKPSAFALTNLGLEMDCDLWEDPRHAGKNKYFLELNCTRPDALDPSGRTSFKLCLRRLVWHNQGVKGRATFIRDLYYRPRPISECIWVNLGGPFCIVDRSRLGLRSAH